MKTICDTCEKFRKCNTIDKKRGMACMEYKKSGSGAPGAKTEEQTNGK